MATIVDLGKQVKAKYPGQYDDLSDEEVGKRVKAKYPGAYDDFSDKTVAVNGHARRRPQKPQEAGSQEPEGRGLPGLLPAAGGFVGGLAGKLAGPAAPIVGPALAGVGGAIGEVGAQAFEDPSKFLFSREDIGRVGGAFAEQAALEAGGRVLGAGAKFGGKKLMQAAIKVSPQAAQTAIREGIVATKGGLERLMGRIRQTAKAEEQIVRAASGQGKGWIDPAKLAREVFQESANHFQGAPQRVTGELSDLMDEFLKDNPQNISPVKLLKMRRYYDTTSANLKRAGGKLKGSAEQVWNEIMSNRVRRALQSELPEIVDPVVYAKITGKATTPAELQVVREGLFPAIKRSGIGEQVVARTLPAAVGTTVGAMTPADDMKERALHASIGTIAGSTMTTPQMLSLLALGMNNPALLAMLGQVPRAGRALLE